MVMGVRAHAQAVDVAAGETALLQGALEGE